VLVFGFQTYVSHRTSYLSIECVSVAATEFSHPFRYFLINSITVSLDYPSSLNPNRCWHGSPARPHPCMTRPIWLTPAAIYCDIRTSFFYCKLHHLKLLTKVIFGVYMMGNSINIVVYFHLEELSSNTITITFKGLNNILP
jgi:hypothetical protein